MGLLLVRRLDGNRHLHVDASVLGLDGKTGVGSANDSTIVSALVAGSLGGLTVATVVVARDLGALHAGLEKRT